MKLFVYSDNYHNSNINIINHEYTYCPTLDFVEEKGYICKNFKSNEDIITYLNNKKIIIDTLICHFKRYEEFIINNIDFFKTYNCNKFIWIDDVHYHYNRKTTYQYQLQINNLIKDTKNIYFFGSYMYVFNKITNMNIESNKLIQYYHGINNKLLVNYNNNPINKLLIYGCSSKRVYPARFYLKNIKNNFIDILDHKDNIYGINLMNYISNYLCTFASCSNEKTPYLVLKFFEIPSTGSLLLAYDEHIKLQMQELGFIDGINYISCDFSNMIEKVKWITDIKNREKVDKIRENGYYFVRKYHTRNERFNKLDKIINFDLNKQLIKNKMYCVCGLGFRKYHYFKSHLAICSQFNK